MKDFRINWSIFEGSTYCEEGIVLFAEKEWDFGRWERWHLPHMKKQADYVREIAMYVPLSIAHERAKRKAKKEGWC